MHTTSDASSEPRGSTKIELWLAGVTEAEVDQTADAVATLLLARGYNIEGNEQIALMAIFASAIPTNPADMAADLINRGAGGIMVPGDVEEI